MEKKPPVAYNVRIYDNGDGTYKVGYVHRLRYLKNKGPDWVDGNKPKIEKLLKEGQFDGFVRD